MTTPGAKLSQRVVADTDALIAVFSDEDFHHQKAVQVLQMLLGTETELVISVATLAELTTTLHRKLNKPELIPPVITQIKSGGITVAPTDEMLLDHALTIFDPQRSKKKTLFDALVVATGKRYGCSLLFAFDTWYRDFGFTLASDLETKEAA